MQPEEVERVCASFRRIADVRVIGAEDALRGERLVACIVVTGAPPTTLELEILLEPSRRAQDSTVVRDGRRDSAHRAWQAGSRTDSGARAARDRPSRCVIVRSKSSQRYEVCR